LKNKNFSKFFKKKNKPLEKKIKNFIFQNFILNFFFFLVFIFLKKNEKQFKLLQKKEKFIQLL